MKDKRWWAITYTNCGDVMPDTIRETRLAAMKACCDNPDEWRPEWMQWKALGCKAVRVVVRRET